MTPNIGDTVRFLNSVGGGRVVKIAGNIAYVDEDGFETPVLLRECVVVAVAGAPEPRKGVFTEPKPASVAAVASVPDPVPVNEHEIEETEGGDMLDVVLGFEATDLKNLSQSSFEAYLVNDSNYWLDFCVLTRADDAHEWILRYRGNAEPNMQIFVGEFGRADLPEMDRIAVMFTAYKTDRTFALKPPVLVEMNLDTTRFARLHCFVRNEYFDVPVIALDIVRNDRPARPMRVDPAVLERSMREKRRTDERPVCKQNAKTARRPAIIEVDLHAAALLDDLRGLGNADILNAQVDRFRQVMDENLRHPGQKIVFIHGKGNGVLREAISKELNHRYRGHDVQDASFREYGFGATQVTIRTVR